MVQKFSKIFKMVQNDTKLIVYKMGPAQQDPTAQVSIHVVATHQTSQHKTLKSQIQMVGPYARLM